MALRAHPYASALVIVAALWAAHSSDVAAQADSSRATASMAWSGDSCATGDELARDVEAHLGREVFVAEQATDLHIVGTVASSNDGVLARFRLVRGATVVGSRELVTADCRELRRALPIVIALAVDLEAAQVRLSVPMTDPSARSSAGSEPPSSDTDVIEVDARPTRTDARPSDIAFDVRAAGAIDVGLLPAVTWSARVALRLGIPGLPPLEARVAFLFPSSALEDHRGVSMWGATGALATCPVLVGGAASSFLLETCVGVDAGVLVVRGEGFTTNRESTAPLFDLFGGVRAGVAIGDAALWLDASLVVPVPSTRFTVTTVEGAEAEVASGQPLGGRLELGISTLP